MGLPDDLYLILAGSRLLCGYRILHNTACLWRVQLLIPLYRPACPLKLPLFIFYLSLPLPQLPLLGTLKLLLLPCIQHWGGGRWNDLVSVLPRNVVKGLNEVDIPGVIHVLELLGVSAESTRYYQESDHQRKGNGIFHSPSLHAPETVRITNLISPNISGGCFTFTHPPSSIVHPSVRNRYALSAAELRV